MLVVEQVFLRTGISGSLFLLCEILSNMNELITKLAQEFHPPFHNSVLIFTTILVIILFAPIILRKIKIPGIIVLILSGIVIGPQGLNLIERNEAVILFSTIGLLYIMFLAGLDLDLHEFALNRNKSILFGFLTFAIPLLVGFPVCFYLLGYGFLTSLLTASMFATHTLIAYPIVSKMDVSRNEAVAITVGGTILTDTAVLMILAAITGSQQEGAGGELWARLGISFTLFFLFMFFVVPPVARWFFHKLENEKYSHYIFVLATVFLSAFLAEIASLEPIIGAFAAGLVLNRLIPKTSPLMNRIEFAGNALFIPFFLISVGMIIDLKAIGNGPWAMVVAAVLSIVALSSKWLAAWLTARLLRYSTIQRQVIFGLSSSHAVATLAVITVGYRMEIIDEHILNGTIILILVTCMVSSLVTEYAARKLAIQEDHDHSFAEGSDEEKIVVPIANPQTMTRLIDLALLFSNKKANVPVYGLAVVRDNDQARQKLAQSKRILEKLMIHAAETDRRIEVLSTIDQNTANGIRRVTKELSATDILIGTSPQTRLSDAIFGKLMDHIINSTSQTVLIYNPVLSQDVHMNIRVICPEYAAHDFGFSFWMSRISNLSRNLGASCYFYCETELIPELISEFKKHKNPKNPILEVFSTNDELQLVFPSFLKNDLIVLVYPRKGSVSYSSGFSKIADLLDRNFSEQSYLIISPRIKDGMQYEDYIHIPKG